MNDFPDLDLLNGQFILVRTFLKVNGESKEIEPEIAKIIAITENKNYILLEREAIIGNISQWIHVDEFKKLYIDKVNFSKE